MNDLSSLTKLRADWLPIKDLSGVENCINLTSLDIGYTYEITDLTPLASLTTNLTELDIAEN